jgi:hypothetical protein
VGLTRLLATAVLRRVHLGIDGAHFPRLVVLTTREHSAQSRDSEWLSTYAAILLRTASPAGSRLLMLAASRYAGAMHGTCAQLLSRVAAPRAIHSTQTLSTILMHRCSLLGRSRRW